MRRFEIALPASLDDCLRAMGERGPETKLLAGGTDLLPQLKNGLLKPGRVVDLSGVARLRMLRAEDGQGLRIGATVTARTLERDPVVCRQYPALAESAAVVGSVQVRNLATVGGNLCNAAPSADMAPPLLALDAEAVIAGPAGERRVCLAGQTGLLRLTIATSPRSAPPNPTAGPGAGASAIAEERRRRPAPRSPRSGPARAGR